MIYEQAHIYAIYDIEDQNLIYYGSTCDLKARILVHKESNHNKCTSKQIIERGNYEVVILETYENIDEYDLHERERWYILNKVCVNKTIPHRTIVEYNQDNKEKIAQGKKEWNQNNKEKMKEKFNCECGGKYTYRHTAQHMKSQKHQKWVQSTIITY